MAEQDAAAKRRARQTVINLSLALAATVAVALVMIMITPRDDSNLIKPVDYMSIAADVSKSTSVEVAIPSGIPEGWWANAARFNDAPADGVKTWHVGFVGPNNQYIGIDQGFKVNSTWIAQKTQQYVYVADIPISSTGSKLQKYNGSVDKTKGQQMWVWLFDGNAVLISGTGNEEEFRQFADLLGIQLN